MQLLGLLLLLLRDLPEATPSRAQRGTKEGFCLVLSQLPHKEQKGKRASVRAIPTLKGPGTPNLQMPGLKERVTIWGRLL